MREIKFRGKRVDNGEWTEGDLASDQFILPWLDGEFYNRSMYSGGMEWCECCAYIIDPTTVGQYTGLCDKNGKEIYEGDILRCNIGERVCCDIAPNCKEFISSVSYKDDAFLLTTKDGTARVSKFTAISIERAVRPYVWETIGYDNSVKVIGNIYDTPDLLNQ